MLHFLKQIVNILGATKLKGAASSQSVSYLIKEKLQIHPGESSLTRKYLKDMLFSLFNKMRKLGDGADMVCDSEFDQVVSIPSYLNISYLTNSSIFKLCNSIVGREGLGGVGCWERESFP